MNGLIKIRIISCNILKQLLTPSSIVSLTFVVIIMVFILNYGCIVCVFLIIKNVCFLLFLVLIILINVSLLNVLYICKFLLFSVCIYILTSIIIWLLHSTNCGNPALPVFLRNNNRCGEGGGSVEIWRKSLE